MNTVFWRKSAQTYSQKPLHVKKTQGIRAAKQVVAREIMVDDVRVVFTPKKVKNINIRVKKPDGHVEASAPQWMSVQELESFIKKKMPWIRRRQSEIAQAVHGLEYEASPKDVAAWRTQIEERTKELVAHWEPIMGVRVKTLAFRNMTSRWGSCNPKTGRVCINVQLAKYPPECLEYVVVHELCHFKERKHGARFKELMSHYLPTWQQTRTLLR
ncbi:MAG: M48 family metallopeptidase [Eggerthellaceae bacterium]|jgi:predicted metal-dependent hydrolase|nr:M48 family metallopeptidase [Eggerthellaceae bacterium]MDR2721278.1 M48 family metallopeptidase [Coriobacteriaceae bacterium]